MSSEMSNHPLEAPDKQVAERSGAFPTALAIGFGVLVWAGLCLRDPRILRWVLLRR